jgi:hypothetical protein
MFTRPLIVLCASLSATGLRADSPAPERPSVAESKQEARVDHALFDALLHDRVRDGLVDYAGLKADPRLAEYLAALEKTDPSTLSRAQRLAYWINVYNAATLKLMADVWPVASIMKINDGKPWDLPVFQPAGFPERLTLNQIEHAIIRKDFVEPRIHFALVCAAISCPPLRSEAYTGERLSAQLSEQTRLFVRDPARNRYDPSAHALCLSPLFQWYAVDFGGATGTPGFVLKYLGDSDRAALKRFSREPELIFGDYDWAPNAQP